MWQWMRWQASTRWQRQGGDEDPRWRGDVAQEGPRLKREREEAHADEKADSFSGVRELQVSSFFLEEGDRREDRRVRPGTRFANARQQGSACGEADEARKEQESAAVFCTMQKTAAAFPWRCSSFAGVSGPREAGEVLGNKWTTTSDGRRGSEQAGGAPLAARMAGGLLGVADGWRGGEAGGCPKGGGRGRLQGGCRRRLDDDLNGGLLAEEGGLQWWRRRRRGEEEEERKNRGLRVLFPQLR